MYRTLLRYRHCSVFWLPITPVLCVPMLIQTEVGTVETFLWTESAGALKNENIAFLWKKNKYRQLKSDRLSTSTVIRLSNYLCNAASCRRLTDSDSVDLFAARQHINDRILDECAEHKDEAGGHPDVDRLRERNCRKSTLARALRRYCQHRQDSERDSSRHRFQVDPERNPRQQDDQHARKVGREDVRAKSTLQVEIGSDARVRSCNMTRRACAPSLCSLTNANHPIDLLQCLVNSDSAAAD